MTEQEARSILFDFFNKHLRENDEIWIGDVYYADERGYSFEAGTYAKDEGRPSVFPVWGVNAIDKSVCPFLAQAASTDAKNFQALFGGLFLP